jgi:hypothetical protein
LDGGRGWFGGSRTVIWVVEQAVVEKALEIRQMKVVRLGGVGGGHRCLRVWLGGRRLGGRGISGLGDFLKNLEADRLGGEGCRGADGEPWRDEEEGRTGQVVEAGGGCGESVSFWGTGCEREYAKGMNKDTWGEPDSG